MKLHQNHTGSNFGHHLLYQKGRGRGRNTKLKNPATHRLKPTTYDGRRIVELVVIEQLLSVTPSCTQHWLTCWKSEHLLDFQELWENFTAAEAKEPGRIDMGKGGHGAGPA